MHQLSCLLVIHNVQRLQMMLFHATRWQRSKLLHRPQGHTSQSKFGALLRASGANVRPHLGPPPCVRKRVAPLKQHQASAGRGGQAVRRVGRQVGKPARAQLHIDARIFDLQPRHAIQHKQEPGRALGNLKCLWVIWTHHSLSCCPDYPQVIWTHHNMTSRNTKHRSLGGRSSQSKREVCSLMCW